MHIRFVSSENRNALLCFDFTMVTTPLWLRKPFSKAGVACRAVHCGAIGSGLLGRRFWRVSVQTVSPPCSDAPGRFVPTRGLSGQHLLSGLVLISSALFCTPVKVGRPVYVALQYIFQTKRFLVSGFLLEHSFGNRPEGNGDYEETSRL